MSAVAPELPGARVLDLFAGSGALGLEALSRGAEHATFVETGTTALRLLRENIESLEAGECSRVVRTDAIRYARSLEGQAFDLAFADPPYGKGLAEELAEIFLDSPFATLLCIEHDRRDRMPEVPDMRSRKYGDTMITFLPMRQ